MEKSKEKLIEKIEEELGDFILFYEKGKGKIRVLYSHEVGFKENVVKFIIKNKLTLLTGGKNAEKN